MKINEDFTKRHDDYKDHKYLMELLYGCFKMDPSKRLSAREILQLPFSMKFYKSVKMTLKMSLCNKIKLKLRKKKKMMK